MSIIKFGEGGEKMNKSYAIPNALAVTTAIVYVLCWVLIGLFPDTFFAVAQSWFHGIELSKSSVLNLTMESFVLGLISSAVTAWVIGYIFAKVYKVLQKFS